MRVWSLLTGACLLPLSMTAAAHNPLTGSIDERVAGLLTMVLLGLFWWVYIRGTLKALAPLKYRLVFHTTTAICLLVVLGPLDDWAKTSTAAHMTQHMLMIVVIAPLWVLARPLPQLRAGGGKPAALLWKPMLRLAQHPLIAAYIHGFVIWFWHTPHFYMLAVNNPWWHSVEHACFLLSAGVFWWAVLNSNTRNIPWAFLALLLTLMHTGILGAILTFSGAPWYSEARSIEDQQLAGLIMWVAGAIPYLWASAWIGRRWFRRLLPISTHSD